MGWEGKKYFIKSPNPQLKIFLSVIISYVISALPCVTLNGQMVVMGYFVDVTRGL